MHNTLLKYVKEKYGINNFVNGSRYILINIIVKINRQEDAIVDRYIIYAKICESNSNNIAYWVVLE